MALTVAKLLALKTDVLGLKLLTHESTAEREIPTDEVISPGLVLAGFSQRFTHTRTQVIGETEITYLASLTPEASREAIVRFLSYDLPVVFITKALDPPAGMIELANERGIPIVSTRLKTGEFYGAIKSFLESRFAPSTFLHGSLVDVYGVGLLFMGRSGIGKSECVLDLVERGHRLVADDQVHVTRRSGGILIGRGNSVLGFHMEIRGVGIIDIRSLFGIRSVRLQKRIEVIVRLEDWDESTPVERVGLDEETDGHPGRRDPDGARAAQSGQEHHRDRRGRGDEPPPEVRRRAHRGAVQRAPDRAHAHPRRDRDVPRRGLRVTGRCGVVVAHGSLADGLLSALSRVAGEQDSLWALSNEGLGGADLEAQIAAILEDRCAGRDAYLLSDMEGGSCGQACRRLLAKGTVKAVFYGVNLPLLVEFVFLQDEPFERFVKAAVEKGRRALGVHA